MTNRGAGKTCSCLDYQGHGNERLNHGKARGHTLRGVETVLKQIVVLTELSQTDQQPLRFSSFTPMHRRSQATHPPVTASWTAVLHATAELPF